MDGSDSRVPLLSAAGTPNDAGNDAIHGQQYGAAVVKNTANPTVTTDAADDDDDDEAHNDSAHAGVQQADAINQVWSRAGLYLAYTFIFLCSFASALQWQIISNLVPYVTSEFSSHSLIPTISIVSSILSGVLKLPISKIIDAWGRPEGLASMTVLATVGLILMAASQNVQTYAAAQVFYQIGISGFSYILTIIVADTSSLKNRALAFAYSSSPNIITTFIGPVIARAFYEHSTWRWAFLSAAIFFFLLSWPILGILLLNARKARQLGLLPETKNEKWTMDTVRKHMNDYDAVGVVLLTTGLTSALVPLSLGGRTSDHLNVFFLILGIVLLLAFTLHEKYMATSPVIAFSLLLSRDVAGSFLLSVVLFVSYFSWDSYYSSYLQVVHGLSISEAGYIDHIYGLGSFLWAVVVGYLIKRTDRYKWLGWAALPVHILGGVSLILFRRPDTHISLLVLCQIFMTIGASTLVVTLQMAVMATCSHAEVASVLALLSLASYIGSAGGNSLSGAIWNSTLPKALAELLPDFSAAELRAICASLKKQLSYPMGSPVRNAIITAYDKAQVRMCITGTALSLIEIIAVALWTNARVSQSNQVKGKVL